MKLLLKSIKKGFTLVELLAIIIIIAIVTLISTPIILNSLKVAQENSNKNSVQNIAKAGEIYYTEKAFNNENITGIDVYEQLNFNGKKI